MNQNVILATVFTGGNFQYLSNWRYLSQKHGFHNTRVLEGDGKWKGFIETKNGLVNDLLYELDDNSIVIVTDIDFFYIHTYKKNERVLKDLIHKNA